VSLRTRLVLSFALVVGVCLGIIAVAVSLIIRGYRDRFTISYLQDLVRPVFIQVRTITNTGSTLDTLGAGLQEQAADSSLYILLVDTRGKVVWQAAPDGSLVPDSLALTPDLAADHRDPERERPFRFTIGRYIPLRRAVPGSADQPQ
jgi:hypothetical protein